MERRIILAAGHGGRSPGAKARGTIEAAQCIDIVNRTAAKLRADGRLEVVVVPHNLDLKEQVAWVNARFKTREAAYAAEIHKNSGGGTGVEAWFLTGSETGRRQAAAVLEPLRKVVRLRNRGVFPDTKNRWGSLAWLRQTKPYAGLFECGFIDVDHFRNDLYAEGLYRGFLALFDLEDREPDLYRVVTSSGKQIGAFRVRSNAWKAYLSVDGDAVILNRERRDVTAEFVEEFGAREKVDGEATDHDAAEEVADLYHDPPSGDPSAMELLEEADTEELEPVGPAEATR